MIYLSYVLSDALYNFGCLCLMEPNWRVDLFNLVSQQSASLEKLQEKFSCEPMSQHRML